MSRAAAARSSWALDPPATARAETEAPLTLLHYQRSHICSPSISCTSEPHQGIHEWGSYGGALKGVLSEAIWGRVNLKK
jgi:hypothetical protein